MTIPTRRPCVHKDVGPFTATIGFGQDGKPCEVFISKRAKTGTELDDHLYELGVAISKEMQGE